MTSNVWKMVPFFSDEIEILVESASNPEFVSKVVSLREFSNGKRVALSENVANPSRLRAVAEDQTFIEGVEAL